MPEATGVVVPEATGNPVSEAKAELLAAAESGPPPPPPPHPASERPMAAELDWMNRRLLMFNEIDEASPGTDAAQDLLKDELRLVHRMLRAASPWGAVCGWAGCEPQQERSL